jgi:tripartite-type tricarboxylate transporter receptor subunit TctC
MKKKRFQLTVFLLAFAFLSWPLNVQSVDYPTRPIKGVVPWGSGGASDVNARALLGGAEKYLKEPIALVNMKGGGGSRGANFVAKSRPDGYTILITSHSCLALYPNIAAAPAYTLDDFTLVCVLGMNPRVFVTRSDAPWNSVKEVIEDARKNPETIRITTSGVTSWGAFTYYGLRDRYPDIKFVPIHMRGTRDSVLAILRGDAHVMAQSYSSSKAQVDAGKFKILGVASETRDKFLTDVPTLKEQGVNFPSDPTIFLVAVPKRTPKEVVRKLEKGMKAIAQSPTTIERAEKLFFNLGFKDQKEATDIIKAASDLYSKLAKKFKLKMKKKK